MTVNSDLSSARVDRPKATHRRLGWIVALAAVLAALALPVAAQADQMTVYSCHTPAGAATGTFGWGQQKPAGEFLILSNTCAASGAGGLIGEMPGRSGGYGSEGVSWVFQAPSWSALVSYKLILVSNYARPYEGAGEGNVSVEPSDKTDPNYDYRDLGGGTQGEVTVARTPPDEVKSLTVTAGCDNYLNDCSRPEEYARFELSRAAFLLSDATTPKVANLTGSLTSGKPLSGTAEAIYEASDTGPGIYAAHYVVDGVAQPTILVDRADPTCSNLGETTDGTRAFDSAEPCAPSVDATSDLETTHWPDGEHHVELVVEDAAGNQVIAFDGTVTFHNATTSSLGAANGPGASTSSSAPTPGVANGTAASVDATVHLGIGSRISRSYARRAFTFPGRLLTNQGQPIVGATLDILQQTAGSTQVQVIGHATTGSGGAFTAKVPGGPSRTVEIVYRAFANNTSYAAQAGVSETVGAGVQLQVSPRSTSPTGTIILSGRVLGPIPKGGVLAELLVYYRGHWEPFRTPRTNSQGRFRIAYQFEGAVGRFPFEAEVPTGQAGFAFSTGSSALVSVATD